MVAYDPIRGTSIKQHPNISKDKDGNKVQSGVYIYQLVVNGIRTTGKMLVQN